MNNFLQTRQQITDATQWLKDNGYINHGISAKDWELAEVLPLLTDGNICDLGSDGSYVLSNVLKKGLKGFKMGIDLAYPPNYTSPNPGIELVGGDLTATPFPDNFFHYVTCLSVLEHDVSYEGLAKECSRILVNGGELFVSFDTWTPKPDTSKTKLYSLDWKILDDNDILRLISVFSNQGLQLNGVIDWTKKDAVINDRYCSPVSGVAYTFSILHFIKTS